MVEKYYTVQEIAELLKTHVITIRRWIQEEKLKATKIGREYRISESQFNEFMQNKK